MFVKMEMIWSKYIKLIKLDLIHLQLIVKVVLIQNNATLWEFNDIMSIWNKNKNKIYIYIYTQKLDGYFYLFVWLNYLKKRYIYIYIVVYLFFYIEKKKKGHNYQ